MNRILRSDNLIYWVCLPIAGVLFMGASLSAVGIGEGTFVGTNFLFLVFFGPATLYSVWLGLLTYPLYVFLYSLRQRLVIVALLIFHHGIWLIAIVFPIFHVELGDLHERRRELIALVGFHGLLVYLIPFIFLNFLLLRSSDLTKAQITSDDI